MEKIEITAEQQAEKDDIGYSILDTDDVGKGLPGRILVCPNGAKDGSEARWYSKDNLELLAAYRGLVEGLKDSIEGMEDMIGYIPEYFQWKHSHQDYIDRAKAILAKVEEAEKK